MSNTAIEITRRQLITAAGGSTLVALVPSREGLFAAEIANRRQPGKADPALPLFTALPYLQPGPSGGALTAGREAPALLWQTNEVLADYTLEYGVASSLGRRGRIDRVERISHERKVGERTYNFTASLPDLELNRRVVYRVRMNGKALLEGYFTTRKPRGVKMRFAAFGDNSYGDISDRAIAYQAYRARPDFVMNTGDTVYESGLDNEFQRYFFPVYNAEQAGPRIGSPLLRSVPFYSTIANHDVADKDFDGLPTADFYKHVDSLGYFTNFSLPCNGPKPSCATPVIGPRDAVASFEACAGNRFPGMANYSFDYGDAHFLCLDSNTYVDPTDSDLQRWITTDLSGTDAAWKFVVYHHPAFNAGFNHFHEQQMRALSPLFEQHGVAMVLSGHEHTYQRTRPLRFAPSDIAAARDKGGNHRLVPGAFTVDRTFDGRSATRPDGTIYITTGAGGKELYDRQSSRTPSAWRHPEDNNADYVACFISDRHSLTVFDVDRVSLSMTQVDEWGREVDAVRLTRA